MQTPKARATSSGTPQKSNSPRSSEASRKNGNTTPPPKPAAAASEVGQKVSPRVVRQLKTGPRYSDHTASSANLATKPPKERSPRVADHKSPKAPASEKKRVNLVSELKNQVSQQGNDPKPEKDQLDSTEELKETEKQETHHTAVQPELGPTPAACPDNRENELDELRKSLSETLSLVEDMKTQLADCKASEIQAHALAQETLTQLADCKASENQAHVLAQETLTQLEAAKKTVEALRSDGPTASEAHDALARELDLSRARVVLLEELVVKLEADIVEVERLRAAEARECREAVEKVRSEWAQREAELESELRKSRYEVEEVRASLMDKETELQGIWEENEGLSVRLKSMVVVGEGEAEELRARLAEKEAEWRALAGENERLRLEVKEEGGNAVREIEAARAAEREAVMKAEEAAAARAEMEAEVRRMQVQSDQWRKAAEAAAAMISGNGQVMERTGSMDSHYSSPRMRGVGSPYVDDLDDELMKKKNANKMKRFGSLWKKQQK